MGRVELSGKRFGRWSVLKFHDKKGKHLRWQCVCDCGNMGFVMSTNLLSGISNSCGCLNRETTAKRNYKHALSSHHLFKVWRSMNNRCYNPKDIGYHNYGGRGIKVCKKWHTFQPFYDDMIEGYESGLTIERINVNKGYSPSNCKWATIEEQSTNRRNNRRLTIDGETKTVTEWAKEIGVDHSVIRNRLKYGWSHKDAVFGKPEGQRHPHQKYTKII